MPDARFKETRMRDAMLAMTVGLTIVTGAVQSPPAKSPPPDVGPVRVAWFDITTSNLSQTREFYGKLFDWKFNSVQGSAQALEIVAGAAGIGTLRVAEGQISGFNGVVYVQVTDV